MTIVDIFMLRDFAGYKRCEACDRVTECDPAHYRRRSRGRIDARWNLLSLCRNCHGAFDERGTIGADEILGIIAARELCKPESILAAMSIVDQLDKNATDDMIEATLAEAPAQAALLVRQALGTRRVQLKRKYYWPKRKLRRW